MLSISSKKSQEVQFPNYHPFLLSPLPTNYNDMRLCIMIQMMTTGTWHSQSMNTPSATTTNNAERMVLFFLPMKPEPFPVYHTHRGTSIYII